MKAEKNCERPSLKNFGVSTHVGKEMKPHQCRMVQNRFKYVGQTILIDDEFYFGFPKINNISKVEFVNGFFKLPPLENFSSVFNPVS